MRTTRLVGIAAILALAPGCLLYVDVNEGGGESDTHRNDDWWDDDDTGWTGDSGEGSSETSELSVQVSVDPFEVPAGEASILDLRIEGDATADELLSVGVVGDKVRVLDVVLRGDGEALLAVDVDAGWSGSVELLLDFGEIGTARAPAAFHVFDPTSDPGGGGGAGDDGTGADDAGGGHDGGGHGDDDCD